MFAPERLVWTADWAINEVELPMSLPAPVSTPHDACRKASKLIRKHCASSARGSERDKCVLHWALHECGLVVRGGDRLRLVLKASYQLTAEEAASRRLGAGRREKGGSVSGSQLLRFYTRERRVYIQSRASGMSARLKGGRYVDVHGSGDYAIELAEVGARGGGGGSGGGGGGGFGLGGEEEEAITFSVSALSLRLEMAELQRTLLAAISTSGCSSAASASPPDSPGSKVTAASFSDEAGSADDGEGGGGGRRGSMSELMVRNLDTGERIHMSEIDERVASGIQPTSLRSLARASSSRQSGWLGAVFGWGGAKAKEVALEPCLKPIPLLSIVGEPLTGNSLRVAVARDRRAPSGSPARVVNSLVTPPRAPSAPAADPRRPALCRFHIGDGLAHGMAYAVSSVTWRRHKCASDTVGSFLCTRRVTEPYRPGADDAGCRLTVTWSSADGVPMRAETAQVVVTPGMRDQISSLVANGRASFEVALLRRSKKPTRFSTAPSGLGGARGSRVVGGQLPGMGGLPPDIKVRRATVKIDGAGRSLEICTSRSGLHLPHTFVSPFSRHTSASASAFDDDILQLSTAKRGDGADGAAAGVRRKRKAFTIRCASGWERDLFIHSLRAFISEWPPPDVPPTPLLVDTPTVELVPFLAGKYTAAIQAPDGATKRMLASRGAQVDWAEAEADQGGSIGAPALHDVLLASTPKARDRRARDRRTRDRRTRDRRTRDRRTT